ncbi:unnamed protein product [Prorocentrum cordatum]|uniref:Pentacotripeptide-repeat region of PRORP domain-containing protein n=1 Tax=Prorocentrum cordatum TaxID=2364126 RepID=A0ABN9UQV4_9DINO|nr:unnamed protein product [Polarella glacialis]
MLGTRIRSRDGAVPFEVAVEKYSRTRQWSAALQLLRKSLQSGAHLSPGHYITIVSACRKAGQWQHALSVLNAMWEAKVKPNSSATMLGSARARRASSGSGLWHWSARCGRRS